MQRAPSLPELQRAFAAALVEGDGASLAPWIAARGIDPVARLQIYRNAGYAIHVEALEAVYPALRALVGADCFDGLATRYSARRGSDTGNLQDFGADFPRFLQAQPEVGGFPWLSEVARLEWLRQEVLLAAQDNVPDARTLLHSLQRHAGEGVAWTVQPHVRLLDSAVPALALWSWALDPRDPAPDPDGRGQCVLLWRRGTQVHMQALDAGPAAILQVLLAGSSPGDAQDDARDPAHVAACLRMLIENELIVGVAPATSPRPVPESRT